MGAVQFSVERQSMGLDTTPWVGWNGERCDDAPLFAPHWHDAGRVLSAWHGMSYGWEKEDLKSG